MVSPPDHDLLETIVSDFVERDKGVGGKTFNFVEKINAEQPPFEGKGGCSARVFERGVRF